MNTGAGGIGATTATAGSGAGAVNVTRIGGAAGVGAGAMAIRSLIATVVATGRLTWRPRHLGVAVVGLLRAGTAPATQTVEAQGGAEADPCPHGSSIRRALMGATWGARQVRRPLAEAGEESRSSRPGRLQRLILRRKFRRSRLRMILQARRLVAGSVAGSPQVASLGEAAAIGQHRRHSVAAGREAEAMAGMMMALVVRLRRK
jgi:hypothetical protein